MSRRIFPLALLALFAGGLFLFGAGPLPEQKEIWTGSVDLHQGDTGTIEFSRVGGVISGKMIVHRNGNAIETPIQGEWVNASITFNRTLSPTSYQPFQGVVTFVDATHVTMDGQFAVAYSGHWSGECALSVIEKEDGSVITINPAVLPKLKRPIAKAARLKAAVLTPGLVLDLMGKAPSAKWTNAWLVLGFPGDPGDSRGFARYVEQARLEDGQVRPKVLETHPHWQPRGLVTGRYDKVRIPAAGAELRAGIGFLEGASGSDGVYFSVRGEFPGYSGINVRREYSKQYSKSVIEDFRQDLSRFAGLEGTLIISVDAGPKSAGQDWAVWIEPKIVSLENEYKFASFVGGAVGSGRDGSRLLNAWGGKSGGLYGTVTVCLLFANVDRSYSLRMDSYRGDAFMGSRNLGSIGAGQTEFWLTIQRMALGEWRESVILDGTYVGDLRYTVSQGGD